MLVDITIDGKQINKCIQDYLKKEYDFYLPPDSFIIYYDKDGNNLFIDKVKIVGEFVDE